MIYTKKTPWTLVLGIIMVAYAYMVQAGHHGARHQVSAHIQARR